jgi:hypothetical protein
MGKILTWSVGPAHCAGGEEQLLKIHDLETAWKDLGVAGIHFYTDRALVTPGGVAVVQDGQPKGYLGYLKKVGVGPETVITVTDVSPVAQALKDAALRRTLKDHIDGGMPLQFFCSTGLEDRLVRKLGLDWDDVFSAGPGITDQAGDKAVLRRLAVRLGVADVFPEHRIVRGEQAVLDAVRDIVRSVDCDFVVLKIPDSASGEGMVRLDVGRDFVGSDMGVPADLGPHRSRSEYRRVRIMRSGVWKREVNRFMRQYGRKDIIVEAGYRSGSMSVQCEVYKDGPRFEFASGQLTDGLFVHAGNYIDSAEHIDPSRGPVHEMVRLTEPFVIDFWQRGYRGVCGFDCIRSERDGRVYLLECNSRVTASTYCWAVAQQVRERIGPSWAVLMRNVQPSDRIRSFAVLQQSLGPALFDGEIGALPFNLRCLSLTKPKFTVCTVGRNWQHAGEIFRETVERLS